MARTQQCESGQTCPVQCPTRDQSGHHFRLRVIGRFRLDQVNPQAARCEASGGNRDTVANDSDRVPNDAVNRDQVESEHFRLPPLYVGDDFGRHTGTIGARLLPRLVNYPRDILRGTGDHASSLNESRTMSRIRWIVFGLTSDSGIPNHRAIMRRSALVIFILAPLSGIGTSGQVN